MKDIAEETMCKCKAGMGEIVLFGVRIKEGTTTSEVTSCCKRKKSVPWTEKEHQLFIWGLRKYGKGNWKSIATDCVLTRTPTQVASHAQKYFLRLSNSNPRRRRSLFDSKPRIHHQSSSTLLVSGFPVVPAALHPGSSTHVLLQLLAPIQ